MEIPQPTAITTQEGGMNQVESVCAIANGLGFQADGGARGSAATLYANEGGFAAIDALSITSPYVRASGAELACIFSVGSGPARFGSPFARSLKEFGEHPMLEKRIGEPCPTCETPLQRRASTFRTIVGDVAFCARCCSSFELATDKDDVALAFGPPELAPI